MPRRPVARTLAGTEHRHHGHRRQDDDHRADRLHSPQSRRRRCDEQGRTGGEPLADRRSSRARHRPDRQPRDDAPPRADELSSRLHAREPHPRSGDLFLARSPRAARHSRSVPRCEGADRAPAAAGRLRRRQRRRCISWLRGRHTCPRLGALPHPQRRARRVSRSATRCRRRRRHDRDGTRAHRRRRSASRQRRRRGRDRDRSGCSPDGDRAGRRRCPCTAVARPAGRHARRRSRPRRRHGRDADESCGDSPRAIRPQHRRSSRAAWTTPVEAASTRAQPRSPSSSRHAT